VCTVYGYVDCIIDWSVLVNCIGTWLTVVKSGTWCKLGVCGTQWNVRYWFSKN